MAVGTGVGVSVGTGVGVGSGDGVGVFVGTDVGVLVGTVVDSNTVLSVIVVCSVVEEDCDSSFFAQAERGANMANERKRHAILSERFIRHPRSYAVKLLFHIIMKCLSLYYKK